MKKIDLHCHGFPAKTLRALNKHYPDEYQLREQPDGPLVGVYANTPTPAWNETLRLEEMGSAGVDVELLSCPILYNKFDRHLAEICSLTNEGFAESCRRLPQHFKAFAHLPFNDIDAALKEMAHCLDRLGFVGIAITSNVGGHYLDEEQFEPFWREVARRRVPVFLHPTISPCYGDAFIPPVLSFPFDSTLATARLICSGLYERYPEIILIVAHLGGTIPFLHQRIDSAFGFPDPHGIWKINKPPRAYMKHLYLETATVFNRGAFDCARELVGVEHLLFGTDAFMPGSRAMENMVAFLESLELTCGEQELIYSKNAERLFGLRDL